MTKKTYYLAITAHRKNAKRHICYKSTDMEQLIEFSSRYTGNYRMELYTGNWELVKVIKE